MKLHIIILSYALIMSASTHTMEQSTDTTAPQASSNQSVPTTSHSRYTPKNCAIGVAAWIFCCPCLTCAAIFEHTDCGRRIFSSFLPR